MKKEPNRFRGIYGGARAAETLGDRAKATAYYKKLLDVAKDADTDRPELQQARQISARNRRDEHNFTDSGPTASHRRGRRQRRA